MLVDMITRWHSTRKTPNAHAAIPLWWDSRLRAASTGDAQDSLIAMGR